jgi:hypothetical protein
MWGCGTEWGKKEEDNAEAQSSQRRAERYAMCLESVDREIYRVTGIYHKTKMQGEKRLVDGGRAGTRDAEGMKKRAARWQERARREERARPFEAPFVPPFEAQGKQDKQGKHAAPLLGTVGEEKKEGRAEARPYRIPRRGGI